MTDLKTLPAATVEGQDISVKDFFQTLQLKGMLRPMIREVVTDCVVTSAAKKEGLSVSDEELQKAVNSFRARRRLNKADDTQQWLAANHMSQEELESGLERTLLQRKVLGKITNGSVDKHFAENRGRFDRARISRIVVKEEGLANEIVSQLNEGGDFTELAKQHSLDRRFRNAGPRGIFVGRNRMPAPLAEAVFAANAGNVVGPINVQDGSYHIVKVHEIRHGELNNRTRAIIQRNIFRDWLQNQVKQAKVEVKLPEYW